MIGKRFSYWCLAGVLELVIALLLGVGPTSAQDGLELEVIVDNVRALPGDDSVEIPVFVKNYNDSVAAFNVVLVLGRPDIMQFRTDVVVEGTLISEWPTHGAFSPGGMYYDLQVSAVCGVLPPYTLAIPPPQLGEIPLVKATAQVSDVPDTLSDRTVVLYVITQPINLFCFSTTLGVCIGLSDGELDTTKVSISNGSLTVIVPYCGDADASEETANVADLTYLVAYLFDTGLPPPFPELADLNGLPGINVADITYLVEYLFLAVRRRPAPLWNSFCCDRLHSPSFRLVFV